MSFKRLISDFNCRAKLQKISPLLTKRKEIRFSAFSFFDIFLYICGGSGGFSSVGPVPQGGTRILENRERFSGLERLTKVIIL